MSRPRDGQGYSGFDDANDFLPDESDAWESEKARGGRDTREWTGGRRMRPIAKLTLALLAVGGLMLVLNATLMKIRHVRIIGSRTIATETIAEQAGLKKDMGYFSVNVNAIREAVERNPYLQFKEMRKQFPDTLVLIVKERAPCANIQGGGALYLVDEDGYVLQAFNEVTAPNNLPTVTGLQVSEAKIGRQIVSNNPDKLESYRLIMEELLYQGVVVDFIEISLTDLNHIYLRHRNGYMAELGTTKELMAKIGTLRAVVDALTQEGWVNGYIDVSIPGEAIYSPQ